MDAKILVYLRAVIVEGVLCTVQRYIRIRHKPLFVAITEDLVERAVQHFFHGNAFHIRHFRIAIAENEIYAAAVLVKDKLYHAESQRHIVQQAAFFQHTQGLGLRACQPYFCAQAAMTAQAALASLKRAAIRHGIYGFILATTSSSRLTAMLTSAHTSMAICFDLDNLHDHTLAEKDITDCLNVLDEYVSEKKLEYRDADTAFWVLAQKEGRAERAKAEFDRYAQQQKARIKELRDIINEIYSHQDEY